MSDPVQALVETIRSGGELQIKLLSPVARPLFNRRNANTFWRALIDKAGVSAEAPGHMGEAVWFVTQELMARGLTPVCEWSLRGTCSS